MYVLIALIIILLYVLFCSGSKSGFSSKPSADQANSYVNQIQRDRDSFATKPYLVNKKKYKWLDPVIHEEIRHSLKTKGDLMTIFK